MSACRVHTPAKVEKYTDAHFDHMHRIPIDSRQCVPAHVPLNPTGPRQHFHSTAVVISKFRPDIGDTASADNERPNPGRYVRFHDWKWNSHDQIRIHDKRVGIGVDEMMRIRNRRFMPDNVAAAESNSESASTQRIPYNFGNRSPGVRHTVSVTTPGSWTPETMPDLLKMRVPTSSRTRSPTDTVVFIQALYRPIPKRTERPFSRAHW